MADGMTKAEVLALPVSFPLWPDAGRAFGYGRTLTFELVHRGEFPCPVLKRGRFYRVNRADLLRALGITDAA